MDAMRHTWASLRHAALLAFCAQLQLAASAADVLTSELTGSWGTGTSLREGEGEQAEIHLLADGFGVMLGSTAAARRIDGVDDGKPAMRAMMGFPVRATQDGAVLTLRPFLPGREAAAKTSGLAITCNYVPEGPTLTCAAPAGAKVMARRSDVVPEEMVRMIDTVR